MAVELITRRGMAARLLFCFGYAFLVLGAGWYIYDDPTDMEMFTFAVGFSAMLLIMWLVVFAFDRTGDVEYEY